MSFIQTLKGREPAVRRRLKKLHDNLSERQETVEQEVYKHLVDAATSKKTRPADLPRLSKEIARHLRERAQSELEEASSEQLMEELLRNEEAVEQAAEILGILDRVRAEARKEGMTTPSRKGRVSKAQVREIRRLWDEGMTAVRINDALELGMAVDMLRRIIRNETYVDPNYSYRPHTKYHDSQSRRDHWPKE